MSIIFCRINDKYGYMSNMSKYGFTYEDIWYPTNEHWYQSRKFFSTPIYLEQLNHILNIPNPYLVATQSRKIEPIRDNWYIIKTKAMEMGLILKFSQNEDIKQKLIDTGSEQLIEYSIKDKFWGYDTKSHIGENMMGKLLMKVRKSYNE